MNDEIDSDSNQREREGSKVVAATSPGVNEGGGVGEETKLFEVSDIKGGKAPVMLRWLNFEDIDLEDMTYQSRLGSGFSGLADALAKDGQYDPVKVDAR